MATAETKTEKVANKTATAKEPSAKDKEIARLKDELSKANSDRDTLRSEMDSIKVQMEMLIKMSMGKTDTKKEEEDEPDIEIGYHGFSDMIVESTDSTVSLRFSPSEIKVVPYEDVKTILKENQFRKNKKLFEKDILYFVDEKYYDKLKVKKTFDLSDEVIKDILLTEDKDKMLNKYNMLTNNGKDRTIEFIFQYKTVDMLLDPSKPLKGWSYENRSVLENYMGIMFDRLIEYSGILKMRNSR